MKKKDLAIDLLEMAIARRDEPAALATALIALDRLAQSRPSHASAHYAAGRVLLLLGQGQLALGAFRLATRNDPEMAIAHYWEGVAHWVLGQRSEALTKFLQALHVEPDLFDAHYDAGQLYQQRKDHTAALDHFKRALELRPDDFSTLKKLLQVLLALDYHGTAQLTHKRLRQVWATSDDPNVQKLRSYVLDTFLVGPLRVTAVETFEPQGDPVIPFTFAVSDELGLMFSVHLESSAALRETGRGWLLSVTDGDVHVNTDLRWAEPPGYHVLKPAVVALIRRWADLDDD